MRGKEPGGCMYTLSVVMYSCLMMRGCLWSTGAAGQGVLPAGAAEGRREAARKRGKEPSGRCLYSTYPSLA
jgi:hypothetical protein